MSIESESQRLLGYHHFDEDVLGTVSEVAEKQRSLNWHDFRGQFPTTKTFEPKEGMPIEVLDIEPDDYLDILFYHLPMGNGLDENMTMRIGTLAAALPFSRIIAAGNPGAPGELSGRIRSGKFFSGKDKEDSVWAGNLRRAVSPSLEYLNHEGVNVPIHVGYSYGADKAAAAAQYSEHYDQETSAGIFMEPAAIADRGFLKLSSDFGRSSKPLKGYIDAANSPAYLEARKLASKDSHGVLGYLVGLTRLSNIAVAHALGIGNGFEDRVWDSLDSQPEMSADIIWGSASEIAINGSMLGVVKRLSDEFPNRLRPMVIEGQKHAMGDDIFLHTALVLQSLKAA